jgi:hypothetical protein
MTEIPLCHSVQVKVKPPYSKRFSYVVGLGKNWGCSRPGAQWGRRRILNSCLLNVAERGQLYNVIGHAPCVILGDHLLGYALASLGQFTWS